MGNRDSLRKSPLTGRTGLTPLQRRRRRPELLMGVAAARAAVARTRSDFPIMFAELCMCMRIRDDDDAPFDVPRKGNRNEDPEGNRYKIQKGRRKRSRRLAISLIRISSKWRRRFAYFRSGRLRRWLAVS